MTLSFRVLGGFAVENGSGIALSLPTRKARALLGYLAANADRPQPRGKLTTLLWSDHGDKQARHNLNQSLVAIRKLGQQSDLSLLRTNGDNIWLARDNVEIDVARFRSLFENNPAEAAGLYAGPLLEGLPSPDPGFEEWLIPARMALHEQACIALEMASTGAAQQGQMNAALDFARRLVSLDPLREEAHRLLMRQLCEAGDRAGALRQYQTCVDTLKRELQVEPELATRALYVEVREHRGLNSVSRPRMDILGTSESFNKPTIAVLPFDDLGDAKRADNLADGLAEDLITALSKLHQLFVIPRQFTTSYKDRKATVQQAATELGVRYALTGSIRIAGNKMRCSIQLIDTAHRKQIWAESYDGVIDELFAVSDDIIRQILIELQVRLTTGDGIRVTSRGTRDLKAWLLFVQGHEEGNKFRRESIMRARELFEAAHRADPDWSLPFAMIGWTHFLEAQRGWSVSREESIRLGMELAQRATIRDPNDPWAYRVLNGFLFLAGDYDQGIALAEKAVTLAPNDSLTLASFAYKLFLVDEIDRALEIFERARRICAILPDYQLRRYGLLLQLAGKTKSAVDVLEGLTRSAPDFLYGQIQLAAAYADLGRIAAARSVIRGVMEKDPSFNITQYLDTLPFKNTSRLEWLRELLMEAGLPE